MYSKNNRHDVAIWTMREYRYGSDDKLSINGKAALDVWISEDDSPASSQLSKNGIKQPINVNSEKT